MGLKFSNFPYMTRNGGRAAILVPLTLEKVPVTKNLNKNPALGKVLREATFDTFITITVIHVAFTAI